MALVIVRLSGNLIQQIIDEMNFARSNPRDYVSRIKSSDIANTYSSADIAETIRFLQTVTPCSTPLVYNAILDNIALEWVNQQGSTGLIGHGDFLARIRNAGTYRAIAENLQYGFNLARDIVIDLIIDQGILGKGHRVNIFNCMYNLVGVAHGPHAAYRYMTDMIFARDFRAS